jgi:hypothetical protein
MYNFFTRLLQFRMVLLSQTSIADSREICRTFASQGWVERVLLSHLPMVEMGTEDARQ